MERFTFKDRPNNQRMQVTVDQYAKSSNSEQALLFLDLQWTYREMQKAYDQVLAQYGLSESKFIILMFLNSEKLGASRATITKLLNSMEKEQWVKKNPSLIDKRAVQIQMTDQGKEVLEAFLPDNFEFVNTLTEELSEEEIDQFFYLLNKIKQGTTKLTKEME